MIAMVSAWRAEIVAYQEDPSPRMYHLGEAFSRDVGELQCAVRARAVEIAGHLAHGDEDDRRAAAAFRTWADALVSAEKRRRLLQGEFLTHAFAGGGCVWELSLRPVPACCKGVAQ
ncbi:hypothetical protein PJ985_10885 [Streptomyces sp. ACA25]|uniref:hypothetical protein n=1 Tax=Streptomyces sp. ACA25 TaxID=3022596 RepID=UPI002307CBBC|nr:hypothetical protein [Streptomyces sp. ACA25]MDB1088070.1 hypothetical protein [Streptomyces sp. ACA25]